MAKTIEEYLDSVPAQWKPGIIKLRSIFESTELVEEIKWGMPNYTLEKKLVAGIGSFKSYFGIWFHQGVFLKDPHGVLINAQEGKTRGMRQWRFSELDFDVELVTTYVLEAIQNQRDGKEIKINKNTSNKSFPIPRELATLLQSDSELANAYEKLTPYKRKEYCEYIGGAKRENTRLNRLEKSIHLILEGKGLNDKYK